MLSSDQQAELAVAICATAEAMGQAISAGGAQLIAEDLSAYEPGVIIGALRACRREPAGRLSLGMVLKHIHAADSRPGKDEAWSIALAASDEHETVVLTTEIRQAMIASEPILEAGDKVGARMAFMSAYERLGLIEAQISGCGLQVMREQLCKELRPEIMGIVQHDEVLQLRKAGRYFAAFEQPWAGHRNDSLLHQQLAIQTCSELGLAIADSDIHTIGAEVRQPVGCQHTQIDVWVALRKIAEPGNQPFRGEGRCNADCQVRSLWPKQACCLVDHGQCTANASAVAQARISQRQATGQAFKQTQIQARLQPAYLLGNCRLGHAQFLGSHTEVQAASHHFKNTQRVQRGQIRETVWHGNEDSIEFGNCSVSLMLSQG